MRFAGFDWPTCGHAPDLVCSVCDMTSGGSGATARVTANIADHMARAGLSQNRLAELTGIPRATLTRRLNGTTPLTLDELATIAAALKVPETILGGWAA